MFRTRDLLILVTTTILTLLVVVIVFTFLPNDTTTVRETPHEVIFSEPKDSYEVMPYVEKNTLRDEREAFIEKVKQTYIPPPVTDAEPIPHPDALIFESETPPPALTTTPEETQEIVPTPTPVIAPVSVPTQTPPHSTGTTTP